MANLVLGLIVALLVVIVTLLLLLLRRSSQTDSSQLSSRLDVFRAAQERTEHTVREEVARNRDEASKAAREQRQELADAFKQLADSVAQRMTELSGGVKSQLEANSEQLSSFARASGERLDAVRVESATGGKQLREEVVGSINLLSETITKTIADLATVQKGQLDSFSAQLGSFAKASGDRLDGVRAESATSAKQLREEVVGSINALSESITKTMADLASIQKGQLDVFSAQLGSFAKASGERLDGVRSELATAAKQLREEVVATLTGISSTLNKTMNGLASVQQAQFETFASQLVAFSKTSSEKLDAVRSELATGSKHLREEVLAGLKNLTEATTRTMGQLALAQRTQLETMTTALAKLSETNEKKLELVRATVEGKLQSMQIDNAKQLEQMRQTVDEKLQGTLEKRLGESFKQVSERLELVHKGLGEMQSLATGVGDLKKVLTNVKTRGTWGEVQLGVLLEQVLTQDQFSTNVATKDGGERVEYAIKLPGQGGDLEEPVWLPIDAKFPVEDYQRLIEAQERADLAGVEAAGKQLEVRVKASAADVCTKYLNPPRTTDFGILFLPIEGLFAEVIRRTGLTEAIQRECRVVIAGPTTLWSILSSLQMGFRTLAIQKRSSEVWNLLGAVKTEWTKYGDVLDSVQKKLHQASDTIEKAKVRSRAVGRKLRSVQELPIADANAVLPISVLDEGDGEGESDLSS